MQSIQQMVTGASQMANSATSVASALAKPRPAASSGNTSGNGSTASAGGQQFNDYSQ